MVQRNQQIAQLHRKKGFGEMTQMIRGQLPFIQRWRPH